MARMTTNKPLPSVAAIQAEATRIGSIIEAATKRMDSSDCNLRTYMHLQVSRAELQAYFAGLMYSLGYTDLLSQQDPEPDSVASGLFEEFETVEEEEFRYVQCFEC